MSQATGVVIHTVVVELAAVILRWIKKYVGVYTKVTFINLVLLLLLSYMIILLLILLFVLLLVLLFLHLCLLLLLLKIHDLLTFKWQFTLFKFNLKSFTKNLLSIYTFYCFSSLVRLLIWNKTKTTASTFFLVCHNSNTKYFTYLLCSKIVE